VVALFPRMMDGAEAKALFKPVDKEELKKVFKFFKVDKSPSPDG
jgi:hypothetical protein